MQVFLLNDNGWTGMPPRSRYPILVNVANDPPSPSRSSWGSDYEGYYITYRELLRIGASETAFEDNYNWFVHKRNTKPAEPPNFKTNIIGG